MSIRKMAWLYFRDLTIRRLQHEDRNEAYSLFEAASAASWALEIADVFCEAIEEDGNTTAEQQERIWDYFRRLALEEEANLNHHVYTIVEAKHAAHWTIDMVRTFDKQMENHDVEQ